ncbi:MAG: NepR family anti-sigma factor [Xanthobacteraceae bacterium]
MNEDKTGEGRRSTAEPSEISGHEMADALGQELRTVYRRLLVEPVPQRLLELLEQLDASPAKGRRRRDGRNAGGSSN